MTERVRKVEMISVTLTEQYGEVTKKNYFPPFDYGYIDLNGKV
jgi:hypothetical protein